MPTDILNRKKEEIPTFAQGSKIRPVFCGVCVSEKFARDPKEAPHSGKPGGPPAFLKESNEVKATGYIPAGSEAVIANTKMLGGGASDTIDVAFDGPGEYPFVCTFPPHGVMMRGVIVVQ